MVSVQGLRPIQGIGHIEEDSLYFKVMTMDSVQRLVVKSVYGSIVDSAHGSVVDSIQGLACGFCLWSVGCLWALLRVWLSIGSVQVLRPIQVVAHIGKVVVGLNSLKCLH